MEDIADRFADIESTNNSNAYTYDTNNPTDSARGLYQFRPSEITSATNRMSRNNHYFGDSTNEPEWFTNLKEHKDARKLNKDQATAVLLANLFRQGRKPGDVTDKGSDHYIKELLKDKKIEDFLELYKRYHLKRKGNIIHDSERTNVTTKLKNKGYTLKNPLNKTLK